MKTIGWTSILLGLQSHGTWASIRRDLGGKNVYVAEMDATAKFDENRQVLIFQDAVTGFDETFGCPSASGKQLTYTKDRKFVTCCLPGQRLLGSVDTAFDCCSTDHDLVGSKETGYKCCPTGHEFDGEECKRKGPVCTDGMVPAADGYGCECPPDTRQVVRRDAYGNFNVVCESTVPPKLDCENGMVQDGWSCVCPPDTRSITRQDAYGNFNVFCESTVPPKIDCKDGMIQDGWGCVCPPGTESHFWGNEVRCRSVTGTEPQQPLQPQDPLQPGQPMQPDKEPGTLPDDSALPSGTECKSGIVEGKCYIFESHNGGPLGYSNRGAYTAQQDSKGHQQGRFQLCKTEECTEQDAINPGEGFYIRDIHGLASWGDTPKPWLDNAKNGDSIGRTAKIENAGIFTITKWTSGKYCLGGLETGITTNTWDRDDTSLTHSTADIQMCTPLTAVEVPCDIRSPSNNCIWGSESGPAFAVFAPSDAQQQNTPVETVDYSLGMLNYLANQQPPGKWAFRT